MRKLSIAVALSVIFAEALFAASAPKLEKEAAEKEEFNRHDDAKELYAQAAEQRMKDAQVIMVKGEESDDPLMADDFTGVQGDDEINVFDEMINGKAAVAKSADTKSSFLIAAALDYERAELSDKADRAFALAEKVPGKSDAGQLALLTAQVECQKLRVEYPLAIECVRKALAFTESKDAFKAKRFQLLTTLSNLLFLEGRYEECLDLRFSILDLYPDDKNRLGPIKGFIGGTSSRGAYREALDACRRFAAIESLPPKERAWVVAAEGRIHRRMGDAAKAAEAAEAILRIPGLSKYDAARLAFDARLSTSVGDEAWEWFERKIRTTEAFGKKDVVDLWSYYGYKAYTRFRPDLSAKARDEIARLKMKPGNNPGLWIGAIDDYKALESFPRAEAEIVFPKDASDFGVESKSESYAKDFGWDAADATECVQQALDSGATTVILENTGSPWYISTVKPRSNQTIILEKGVQVIATEAMRKANPSGCHMFDLRGVSNVAIVGKGDKPEDVYVGKYRSREERFANCREEGGSGFMVVGCRNILIRNLKVADCSQDGLCLSGANREIFVEDVILDSNYRQACSICGASGLYFRRVSFQNTVGGAPMLGIDLEPAVETSPNANIYLFDCHFEGNAGGALNFGTSTYCPVTFHAKRCTFEPHGNGDILIFARCGIYMEANAAAPSRIIFEDCHLKQFTSAYAIRFNTSSLFNVEFRNVTVEDIGKQEKEPWWPDVPPILFALDRDFWLNPVWKAYDKEGAVKFDNLVVQGFKDRDLVSFRDQNGHYSVRGVSGSARHNGQEVDMSQYRYEAPDVARLESPPFDPAAYGPPAEPAPADSPAVAPASFDMLFKVPWYVPTPTYTAVWWDGQAWRKKPIRKWCKAKGLGGKAVAYHAKNVESIAKLSVPKGREKATIYFEVPAGGGECVLKATGSAKVLSPSGEVTAGVFAPGARGGYRYFTIKPASDKAEIWSLEFSGDTNVKFFAPLAGVFAEKAEWLPRAR